MGKNLEGHFWFSKKMYDRKINKAENNTEPGAYNYCIIDGKELEYTAMSENNDKAGCLHDDLVYLGYGKYSRSVNIC